MRYLTAQQILFIHSRLIDETGGKYGLRDLGLLASASERPKATFDGQDLYPDIYTKAAALMESLVGNHPFVDGNKRVGITAVALFLQLNGYHLKTTNDELERFALSVASGKESADSITVWLRDCTGLQAK